MAVGGAVGFAMPGGFVGQVRSTLGLWLGLGLTMCVAVPASSLRVSRRVGEAEMGHQP